MHQHDDRDGYPRVSGDDVGTGKDLNVSCATADLDPSADHRERNGVGPSLERDRAIGSDAARDRDVERLWHRLGKRTEVCALSLPGTERVGTGGRADPSAHRFQTTCVGMRLDLLERLPLPAVRAATGTVHGQWNDVRDWTLEHIGPFRQAMQPHHNALG